MELISALIGGLFSLLASLIVIRYEYHRQRQERIEHIKPILINHKCSLEKNCLPQYVFVSNGCETRKSIIGLFKNTDNGIVFIDKIESDNKVYTPKGNSTVEKNTAFIIELHNILGDNFCGFKLFCHDIENNKYYYDLEFDNTADKDSDLILGNINKLVDNK